MRGEGGEDGLSRLLSVVPEAYVHLLYMYTTTQEMRTPQVLNFWYLRFHDHIWLAVHRPKNYQLWHSNIASNIMCTIIQVSPCNTTRFTYTYHLICSLLRLRPHGQLLLSRRELRDPRADSLTPPPAASLHPPTLTVPFSGTRCRCCSGVEEETENRLLRRHCFQISLPTLERWGERVWN